MNCDIKTLCAGSWYIATQERIICDTKVEIVTLVVKRSAMLTFPPDRYEQIQAGIRIVALCIVFDLKLGGIHLTEIFLKVRIIYRQYFFDMSICEVELRY